MRVGYVIPYLEKPSGWKSLSCNVINAICKYVEPVLFVAESDFEVAQKELGNYTIISLPVTQKANLMSASGILKLGASLIKIKIKNFPDIDLVHSLEAYPSGLIGNWIAQKIKKPHFITVCGTFGIIWHGRCIDRVFYTHVLNNAKVIIPISGGTKAMMIKYFGLAVNSEKTRIVLLGNNYFNKVKRSEMLSRLPSDTPVILSVGSIKPRKGYHSSIAAFAKVKEKFPLAQYHIVGSVHVEKYYHDIKKLISSNRLNNIVFHGEVTDEELSSLYQTADVFVLTPEQDGYDFEGFGLVYLEAGAYGLPVVATKSGGVIDAVRDGESGIMVEPGDIDGIANAIIRLLEDHQLSLKLGGNNRDWSETLTWDRYGKEMFETYKELI